MFKKPTIKKWVYTSKRCITEYFIEATENGVEDGIKESKGLEKLKHRQDIVMTNVDKGGEVVILDFKDYIKEFERQSNNTGH